MPEADVLVVGGGLGGSIAALAAAEAAPDATVELVGPREHPFDAETGLIDVLGYPAGGYDPAPDPFAAIDELPDEHPYRLLGAEALREGLACFDRATAGTYAGANADENALVPSVLGGCLPAARYPAAVEPGLVSREASTTLVGFESLPGFDPDYAAERLRAMDPPFDVEAIEVTLPLEVDDRSPGLSIARGLDENEPIGRSVPLRESAARTTRAYLGDSDRVGVPAVLGLAEPAAVHATFAAELDAEVFEIPSGSPSVPGRRLERTLADALTDAGVTVHRGVDVASATADGGQVRVDLEGAVHEPGAVVLATGGPAAGGIVADRAGMAEPLFDCHVPHPEDRGAWAAPDPLGSHALAAAGVRIDGDARPLSAGGEPVAESLFAAGRVVGGGDFVAERSVGGVSLATGYVAGTGAAARVAN